MPHELFRLLAPAALLTIRGRDYQGRVVRLGAVSIDRGCGLGAEVAAFCVEVDRGGCCELGGLTVQLFGGGQSTIFVKTGIESCLETGMVQTGAGAMASGDDLRRVLR